MSIKYIHKYLENPRVQVKILTDFSGFKMASVALHQVVRELLLLIFVETGEKFKLGASVSVQWWSSCNPLSTGVWNLSIENAVCGVSALYKHQECFQQGYNTDITGDPVDTGLDAK